MVVKQLSSVQLTWHGRRKSKDSILLLGIIAPMYFHLYEKLVEKLGLINQNRYHNIELLNFLNLAKNGVGRSSISMIGKKIGNVSFFASVILIKRLLGV